MIAREWRRLAGNAVIAAHLPGQRRVPFWPRERLEALRDRRVRTIVAHAAATVPFYRDWFERERLDPRTIRSAGDLARLPLLERGLVRAEPHRLLSQSTAARDALAFTSSGTSGTPLAVHHDRRSLLANIAYGERERDPVIALCGSGFRPTELYVGYQTSTFKRVQEFYAANTRLPIRPARSFVSLLEPVETVAARVNAERPDVLVGYGGWIDLFFKTVAARHISLHPPKLVMYMGEALPHGAGAFIRETFGLPLLSRYNAVEAFKIGFTCAQGTGFHVHEDLCHLRIVRPDGREAAPGESGEIVISNLINRATVLLNYPIGDIGALSAERCACGRTFVMLDALEGRVEDMLPLADGRVLHPRAIWEVLKGERDVLQYQLTQHEPRRFTLALATVDEAAFVRARARALPALAHVLDADAIVDVERRAELARGDGGKFRAVVSRVAHS